MAERSKIEWTDATWNPWHGCIKVSPGCKNCYMYRDKARYGQDPSKVQLSKGTFNDPLKWKTPRMIFACSWSDFFIEEADTWRKMAWNIIRATPQHTYQILTKRPERILDHLPLDWDWDGRGWPNVWLGVSVENQETADMRIPILQQIPAEVRWVSAEPLLEQIDLKEILASAIGKEIPYRPAFDWVVVGGESGSAARPMDKEWAIRILKQSQAAGVKFFMKQGSQNNWHPFKNFDNFPPELKVREFPNG